MASRDPRAWMWIEACRLVDRAERLQRRFFEPVGGPGPGACWEPPVDIFESDRGLWVIVALPGVGADDLEVVLEDGTLIVAGRRRLPVETRGAAIHRLELPHGRFLRRIALPARRWQVGQRELSNGCLILRLSREIR